jgi:hypothetical protein
MSGRTVHDLGAVFSNTQTKLNRRMLERIRLSMQADDSVGSFERLIVYCMIIDNR